MLRVRRDEGLDGGHRGGHGRLHVGCSPAVEHAVADFRPERRRGPFFQCAGRHDVGVAGKDEQRGGCAASRPEVGHTVAVDVFDAETERFQALGDDFHAAAVFRRDGVAGDDLPGEFKRGVGHQWDSSSGSARLIVNSLNEAPPSLVLSNSRATSVFLSSLPLVLPNSELLISHDRLVGESALASASSMVIVPLLYRLNRSCSKVCDPGARVCSMASLMPCTSPRSISSLMWRVLSMISEVGMRLPSGFLTRRCEMMARRATDRSRKSAGRFSAGKKLMMRFRAW